MTIREILERDRDKLETVAQFLLKNETMDAKQFQQVYDDPAALETATEE
jgi:ATP-dependent Zn protease